MSFHDMLIGSATPVVLPGLDTANNEVQCVTGLTTTTAAVIDTGGNIWVLDLPSAAVVATGTTPAGWDYRGSMGSLALGDGRAVIASTTGAFVLAYQDHHLTVGDVRTYGSNAASLAQDRVMGVFLGTTGLAVLYCTRPSGSPRLTFHVRGLAIHGTALGLRGAQFQVDTAYQGFGMAWDSLSRCGESVGYAIFREYGTGVHRFVGATVDVDGCSVDFTPIPDLGTSDGRSSVLTLREGAGGFSVFVWTTGHTYAHLDTHWRVLEQSTTPQVPLVNDEFSGWCEPSNTNAANQQLGTTLIWDWSLATPPTGGSGPSVAAAICGDDVQTAGRWRVTGDVGPDSWWNTGLQRPTHTGRYSLVYAWLSPLILVVQHLGLAQPYCGDVPSPDPDPHDIAGAMGRSTTLFRSPV